MKTRTVITTLTIAALVVTGCGITAAAAYGAQARHAERVAAATADAHVRTAAILDAQSRMLPTGDVLGALRERVVAAGLNPQLVDDVSAFANDSALSRTVADAHRAVAAVTSQTAATVSRHDAAIERIQALRDADAAAAPVIERAAKLGVDSAPLTAARPSLEAPVSIAYVETFDLPALTSTTATVSSANDAEQARRDEAERARKVAEERAAAAKKAAVKKAAKPAAPKASRGGGGQAIAWLSQYGPVRTTATCKGYCGYTWEIGGDVSFEVSASLRDDSKYAWRIAQHEAAHAIISKKEGREWVGPAPYFTRGRPGEGTCWQMLTGSGYKREESVTDAVANIIFGTPFDGVYPHPNAQDWAIAKVCAS